MVMVVVVVAHLMMPSSSATPLVVTSSSSASYVMVVVRMASSCVAAVLVCASPSSSWRSTRGTSLYALYAARMLNVPGGATAIIRTWPSMGRSRLLLLTANPRFILMDVWKRRNLGFFARIWSSPEKVVVERIRSGDALGRVRLEQLGQQIQRGFAILAEKTLDLAGVHGHAMHHTVVGEVLQRLPSVRRRSANESENHIQLVPLASTRKGGLSSQQLHEDATGAPNVHFRSVRRAPEQKLWCPIPKRDHIGGEFGASAIIRGETKIGKLQIPRTVEQKVGSFHITVHNATSVALIESVEELSHETFDLGKREFRLALLQGKQAGKVVWHVIKHKDKLSSFRKKCVQKSENILVGTKQLKIFDLSNCGE